MYSQWEEPSGELFLNSRQRWEAPLRLFLDDLRRWANIFVPDGESGTGWRQKVQLVWGHQPVQATAIVRLGNYLHGRGVPVLPNLLRRINIMMNGLDIVVGIPIGGGLYLPHTVGTVVMARAVGRNVTLVSNVTIGMRNSLEFPVIGNDVYIGAGARVLGPITIGDGAVIGANAVILSDVPPGATAVGVPARVLERASAE